VNRYLRRLARFGKNVSPRRPQDVPDPRTKSSGHGKSTADKWNQ
jgi:hypothetical protein